MSGGFWRFLLLPLPIERLLVPSSWSYASRLQLLSHAYGRDEKKTASSTGPFTGTYRSSDELRPPINKTETDRSWINIFYQLGQLEPHFLTLPTWGTMGRWKGETSGGGILRCHFIIINNSWPQTSYQCIFYIHTSWNHTELGIVLLGSSYYKLVLEIGAARVLLIIKP